jgi:mRNA interferase RelE/StbE
VEVKYEAKFQKDLRNITDHSLLKKLKSIIEECKDANHIYMINNLKKLKGYETFYRIRISEYRIGIEIVENTIIFTRILQMAMILEILGGLVRWVSSKLNSLLFKQANRSSISQRLLDSGINRFGLPLPIRIKYSPLFSVIAVRLTE